MSMLFDVGILDAEQVHDKIGQHYQKISESIQYGQNAYEHLVQVAPEQCMSFTPTTKANIVHNNMIEHATKVFSEIEGVVCYSTSSIFTVDFFGEIRLRFKKLDSSLKPSNISTVQQQDFSRQTLFGDGSTKITAGYRLDRTGIGVKDLHLVCWYNDSLFWNIQLPDAMEMAAMTEVQTPITPSTTIVVPKTTKISKKG